MKHNSVMFRKRCQLFFTTQLEGCYIRAMEGCYVGDGGLLHQGEGCYIRGMEDCYVGDGGLLLGGWVHTKHTSRGHVNSYVENMVLVR